MDGLSCASSMEKLTEEGHAIRKRHSVNYILHRVYFKCRRIKQSFSNVRKKRPNTQIKKTYRGHVASGLSKEENIFTL